MIRFEHATVERAGHVVAQQIELRVLPGQSLALIGRSGAGKSTLLAAAATAVPLHAGDILVDGHSVRREAEAVRRTIGYVPARLPGWPGIRVDEFVELSAAAAGLQAAALREAVTRAVAMAGLEARRHEPLDALDAGHGKRLLLARSLVHGPQVLLLDDPFAGLDPLERLDMEQLVADAHLMGRTVLAAVDDAAVPPCFTHVAVMREGRIVAAGPADPAVFGAGRRLRYRLTCRGRAEEAATVLGRLVDEARAVDLDQVDVLIDAAVVPPARLVQAVVQSGLAVDAAGFHPSWTAQLLE